ncbi:ABC transporter permease [Aquimarina aquimarini]|uniref:ABC transporter permease n=1 Tax=Aquimarina aquimarini TaxID=1191734 RepID=UPI000D5580A2|nr:ABC transporter permease [Aquimarina aquimarini]
MFKNYIKIAIRNFRNQPFLTFLNIFGLAIGMMGSLLICLYIYDEFSYDKMFADADRIYKVNVDLKYGSQAREFATAPPAMASALVNDYPQVEQATRFRRSGSMMIHKTDTKKNIKSTGNTFVDPSFFDMFGIHLIEGDVKTALQEPNTLVLTKSGAQKYFGSDSALGKNLVVENRDTYTVTGIIDDFPQNSFLRDYTVFMAMSGLEDSKSLSWTNNNFYTFVKLIPGENIKNFEEKLQSIFSRYVVPFVQKNISPDITEERFKSEGNYLRYTTTNLTDIHLSSNRVAEMNLNNDIQNIYILSCIALFLILLAIVNFMNLSTAQSLRRAKEVGVRKTLGSNKWDLIKQFLTESGVQSGIALLLAITIATIAMPYFNQLSGKMITIPFDNPIFWLILVLAVLVLGILSGSYPAFYMSKFKPALVLKGGKGNSIDASRIRNILVVFQFAISVILILSTLVIYQQLQFIKNKDVGFAKEQTLLINDVYTAGDQLQSFKQEVQQLTQVKHTTLTSFLPTPSNRRDHAYYLDGVAAQENTIQMQSWAVDHDYVSTLDLEIIAGRDFDRQFKTDSTAIIINETSGTILGLTPAEAIGKKLALDDGSNETIYTVIGVIKDFHFQSLRDDVEALGLRLESRASMLVVKLDTDQYADTIDKIEQIWNKVASGQPFDYYFMDDSFNNLYQSEQQLGDIFITFTSLSLLIACFGLFGLATFNAEKRTREIGVRKVMGASVSQVTYKLTIDFLKLVGIAIVIALPIGWYAMNRWLEGFSYHTELSWPMFALVAFIVIAISILTISYQSIKAAMANPVKSLRTE